MTELSFVNVHYPRDRTEKNIILINPSDYPNMENKYGDDVIIVEDVYRKTICKESFDSYKKACEYLDKLPVTNNSVGLINKTCDFYSVIRMLYAYALFKTRNIFQARKKLLHQYNITTLELSKHFRHPYEMLHLENAFCD